MAAIWKRITPCCPLTNLTKILHPRTFVLNVVKIDRSVWSSSRSHPHSKQYTYALKTALFKIYVFKVNNGNIAFTIILHKVGLLQLLSCEPCNCVLYILYVLGDVLVLTHQIYTSCANKGVKY